MTEPPTPAVALSEAYASGRLSFFDVPQYGAQQLLKVLDEAGLLLTPERVSELRSLPRDAGTAACGCPITYVQVRQTKHDTPCSKLQRARRWAADIDAHRESP